MPLSETWHGKEKDLLQPHADLLPPHLTGECISGSTE